MTRVWFDKLLVEDAVKEFLEAGFNDWNSSED